MMENIALIGSSGHAKVVIDLIEHEGRRTIVGLVDGTRRIGEQTLGYSILGREEDLPKLVVSHSLHGVVVAIGDNFLRWRVASRVSELCPELPFVSAIHPDAYVSPHSTIEDGTVILAGVVVNSCCSVGRLCILNTNASLDHDSTMEAYSSLAPGVAIGGNCTIGHYSAICIGAAIAHGIRVGKHTVVGAGSTVVTNIPSYRVAYGSPAKEVRERVEGEGYL